jgi:hypothetical protein
VSIVTLNSCRQINNPCYSQQISPRLVWINHSCVSVTDRWSMNKGKLPHFSHVQFFSFIHLRSIPFYRYYHIYTHMHACIHTWTYTHILHISFKIFYFSLTLDCDDKLAELWFSELLDQVWLRTSTSLTHLTPRSNFYCYARLKCARHKHKTSPAARTTFSWIQSWLKGKMRRRWELQCHKSYNPSLSV